MSSSCAGQRRGASVSYMGGRALTDPVLSSWYDEALDCETPDAMRWTSRILAEAGFDKTAPEKRIGHRYGGNLHE